MENYLGSDRVQFTDTPVLGPARNTIDNIDMTEIFNKPGDESCDSEKEKCP